MSGFANLLEKEHWSLHLTGRNLESECSSLADLYCELMKNVKSNENINTLIVFSNILEFHNDLKTIRKTFQENVINISLLKLHIAFSELNFRILKNEQSNLQKVGAAGRSAEGDTSRVESTSSAPNVNFSIATSAFEKDNCNNAVSSPSSRYRLPAAFKNRLKLNYKNEDIRNGVTAAAPADSENDKNNPGNGNTHQKPLPPHSALTKLDLSPVKDPEKVSSSGESSCSSAMSSMKSVRSNSSDRVQSILTSESGGAVSSMSLQSSDIIAMSSTMSNSSSFRKPLLNSSRHSLQTGLTKFQMLSPISDKSQEQCSNLQTTYKYEICLDCKIREVKQIWNNLIQGA